MNKKKIFRMKLKDSAITLGLTALAVLFAVADAAGEFLISFPDQRTSLSKALRKFEKYHPKSVKEYLEELKETTGVNLRNTISRLKEKGLIIKSGKGYKLTGLGQRVIGAAKAEADSKLNWDGRWRLVTFDIPEKKKHHRNWLRSQLKLNEYKSLHKSVFVGKFPLPEDLYRELHAKRLTNYIRLLTVGEIDVDL